MESAVNMCKQRIDEDVMQSQLYAHDKSSNEKQKSGLEMIGSPIHRND